MFSATPRSQERRSIWRTRISKTLAYALVLPLISVIAAASTPQAANAVTVGSGICAQTVSSSTGVTASQLSGGDCLVTFTSGTVTWTAPTYLISIRVLVVAGGGSGDRGQCTYYWGHGGGGGQVKDQTISISSGGTYTATVGAGGLASGGCSGTSTTTGNSGYSSSFSTISSSPGLPASSGAQAVGGTSGSGKVGGTGGGAALGGGGGGGDSAAGSGLDGGAGTFSNITGSNLMYGMGGPGKDNSVFGKAYDVNGNPQNPGTSVAYVPPANTGAGGSDQAPLYSASTPGAAGVVVIRYPTSFTTTFSANTSSSGSPSSTSATTTLGSSFTFPSIGTMAKPGFTFIGWNTAPDGSGTMYSVGASYYPGSNLTYYATWRAVISYDSNTATSARSIETTTTYTSDALTTLSTGKLKIGTPISNGLVFNMNAADSSSVVGNTWYDYSRNGVAASFGNSPTYNSSGGYIQLNGTNQYIDLGSSYLTGSGSNPYTVSVTFKSDFPNQNNAIIMGRYSASLNGGQWLIRQYANSKLDYWKDGYGDLGGPSPTWNEGDITTATVSFSGSMMKLYLNGYLINSVATSSSAGVTATELFLGALGSTSGVEAGFYWGGRIYSTQAYSRALSDTEVAQNYQTMLPGQIASKANYTLVGYNTKADGTGTSYGTISTDLSALPTPYLRMQASGYNSSTKTWTPSVGSTSVTIGGSPTYNASGGGGNGAAATFATVSGATTDSIKFGNPTLTTYTFCYVARYKTGTNYRIIQGDTKNWVSGFFNDGMSDYYHEGWAYYPSAQVPKDLNWHYSCESAERAWWDGTKVPSWTYQTNTTLPSLDINTGTNPTEASNFEFADLIIYNQYLSDTQVAQVNRYIKNTYGIYGSALASQSAVLMVPPTNYSAPGDTTLYAQWGSTITYDGNLQSSGSAPSPSVITSSSNTLATNTGSLTRAGYRFDGWNTSADGSGTNYPAGGIYPNTGNAILYAQWTKVGVFPLLTGTQDPNYLKPYMRFRASDFDPVALTWKDSSGNGRNITSNLITGTPFLVTDTATNGTNKSFQVVQGRAATEAIRFNNSTLSNYTLFSVARYAGTNQARIIQADDGTALYGFWAGKSGVSWHNGWITQYGTSVHADNWVVSTDQSQLYRSNGVSRTTTPTNETEPELRPISINYNQYEHSDFQVAEVIIFDYKLSSTQIQQVEDYLASTYGITGYTSATTVPTSLTYAFATTVGGRTDTLTALNGLGTKSFSVSPQVSGITIDTSTPNGVALVVSSLVPVGSYTETLTATDQAGYTSTFPVNINVVNAIKWSASNATTLTTTVGTSASLQLAVTNGTTGRIASLSKPSNVSLPGISIDTSTLASSGYITLNVSTMVMPGTYTLTLSITDDAKRVNTQNVVVTVNPMPLISYANGVADTTTVTKTGLWLQYEFPASYAGSGTVKDLTGNNVASTIVSGTPYSSTLGGGSVSLDATHSLSANFGAVTTSDSLSKFYWIYPTAATGSIVDACDSACGYQEAELALVNNQLQARVWNLNTLTTTDTITLNAWHYVGYIYNASGTISIYIDGKLSATAATSGTRGVPSGSQYDVIAITPTSAPLGASTGLPMSLGAMHYYKRVLSAQEVFNNYAASAPKYLSTTVPGSPVSGSASIATTQGVASTYPVFAATLGTGNKALSLSPPTSGISIDTSTLNAATLNIASTLSATNSSTAAFYAETITATDSVSAVTNYKLSITVNPPVVITPTVATTLSTTYGYAAYDTFTATFGTGSYTFSNTSSAYSSAFTLTNPTSTAGLLKVANNLPVGTYYDTVTVADAVGAATNYVLTIVVNATLSLAGSPSNALSTTIGKSASLRINISNGTGTKSLTMTSPYAGITLDTSTVNSGYATLNVNGTIPANKFSAVINGVDSATSSASVTITITVNKWPTIGPLPAVSSGLRVNLDGGVYSGSGAWLDQSGNGYNVTLGSGANPAGTNPTYTTNSGGAFSFNETSGATTNYAQIAYPGSLETFTVSAWAKFSSIQSSSATTLPCVICQSWPLSGAINYAIHFTGNTIVGQFYNGGWSNATTAFTPAVNTWYYFTYTVYKFNSLWYQDLYVNGVRQGTAVSSSVAPVGQNSPINIGKRWDSTANEFINGQIGGVSIYSRSLSDTEVVQNFNATGYRYLTTNSGTASIVTTQGVTTAVGPISVSNGTQPYVITLSPTVSGVSIDTSVAGAYTLNLNGLTTTDSVTTRTILETVTATDSTTASTTLAYTISVNPPVQESYTSASLTTTSGIVAYDTFTASYGTGNKTFALTGSPSTNGFSLTTNGNQAVLSVTSGANPGTYYETVTATDSVGATKSLGVTITIYPGPTLSGPNNLIASKGVAFRSPVYAVVNGLSPYSYALTSKALSPDTNTTTAITFDSSTMTIQISNLAASGTYIETLTVTDSKGAASKFNISVTVKDPILITGGSLNITKYYGDLYQQTYFINNLTGAAGFRTTVGGTSDVCVPIVGTNGTNTYEMFTSVGSCSWIAPAGISSVDYVVAAGGGSGGNGRAGGGGGGGVAQGTALSVTGGSTYGATIGAGGAAPSGATRGNQGGDSWFGTSNGSTKYVSAGGGGGGGALVSSSSNNGANGNDGPTATVKSAGGAGGGGGPNFWWNAATLYYSSGGSSGAGTVTSGAGGRSYRCDNGAGQTSTNNNANDGQKQVPAGRTTGGGGGANASSGTGVGFNSASTCPTWAVNPPNGGTGVSTTITGNTIYLGYGGGGSDGRGAGGTEYSYGSSGPGIGSNGGGSGEAANVPTSGTDATLVQSAVSATSGTDNSGGGGGGGINTAGNGGSGAIILSYATQPRVSNAVSLTTISNGSSSANGSVLLTIPELVAAGTTSKIISVTAAGTTTPYTISITILKETSTVALALPGGANTAKYGNAISLTAALNNDGVVTFYDSGTAITGCSNLNSTSLIATCTWTPTSIGTRSVTASFTPSDTTDFTTTTSSAFNVVVNPADTLTITAGSESFTYNGSAAPVTKPFTYSGLVSIDTLAAVNMIYSGTANDSTSYNNSIAPSKAGTYTITADTTTSGVATIYSHYVSVTLVTGTLTVNRATPTLSLAYTNGDAVTYSPTATLDTVTATRSGTGMKSFASITPITCSADATSARITVLQAGYCQVTMTVAQDPNYLTANYTDTVTINKATRTISLSAPVTTLKYYDTTTVTTTISAGSSDGSITYSLNATPGCAFDSLGGILQATSGTLPCTLNATIAAGTNYMSASTTSALNMTIAPANAPVITINPVSAVDYASGNRAAIAPTYSITGFKGTDNWSSVTLTYAFVSNPFETFSYNDTRTPIDAGTYSITPSNLQLSSGLLTNYQTPSYATSAINFTINRIAQAPVYIDNVNGDVVTPFTLTLRGGSNPSGASTFTASGAGCSISGTVLTATSAGLCLVRGTLSAGRNYIAVQSDTTTVSVRSYSLIPVFTFSGNAANGISISGGTSLTLGASSCSSGCVPTITTATPNQGYPGDIIVLTGTGFTGVTAVIFNVFTNATTFNADSDTQITVQIPAGLLTNSNDSIEVVTPGGTSARFFDFTVLP